MMSKGQTSYDKAGNDGTQCEVLDSPRRHGEDSVKIIDLQMYQNHRQNHLWEFHRKGSSFGWATRVEREAIVSSGVLQSQGKRHDGSASPAGASFQLTEQRRLHFLGIDCHLAGSDLLFAGAVITEFADTQTSLGLHRRTEDAAGHWSHRVEIAHPTLGIEDGARFVIGELF